MPPSRRTARTTWANPPHVGATAAPPRANPSPPTTAPGRPGMRQRPSAGTSCGTTWRRSSPGGERPESDGWLTLGLGAYLGRSAPAPTAAASPFSLPLSEQREMEDPKSIQKDAPAASVSSLRGAAASTAPPRIPRGSLGFNGVLFPNSSIAGRIWSRRRRRGLGSCAAVRTGRAGSGSPDT